MKKIRRAMKRTWASKDKPVFSKKQIKLLDSLLDDTSSGVRERLLDIGESCNRMIKIKGMKHKMQFLSKTLVKNFGAYWCLKNTGMIEEFAEHLRMEALLVLERLPAKRGSASEGACAYITPVATDEVFKKP